MGWFEEFRTYRTFKKMGSGVRVVYGLSAEKDEEISQTGTVESNTKSDEQVAIDVCNLSEEEVLSIVDEQFGNIVSLEKNVNDALKAAENAKSKADKVSNEKVRWVRKHKDNIEHLQDAVSGIGEAVVSSAEASKMLFEYMTRLTKATGFLFRIGIESIAATECVFRQLEAKLKGASSEELSSMAKQELLSVIIRLKQHRSMIAKQEILTDKLKEQATQINKHNERLGDIEEVNEGQDEQIAENAQDIDELEKQDEEQDKLIAAGIKKDEEHDERIYENAQDIDQLERQDAEQDERINFLSQQLDDANQKIAELEERLTGFKINKWRIILSIGVSASLLLNLLRLFGIL